MVVDHYTIYYTLLYHYCRPSKYTIVHLLNHKTTLQIMIPWLYRPLYHHYTIIIPSLYHHYNAIYNGYYTIIIDFIAPPK